MKEFLQSLIDSSKDRIKSPFIGTYIIAFTIYNWRLFLILFASKETIENRIDYIDLKYCNYQALLIPLLITTLYITILPYINLAIDWFLNSPNTRRKIRKHKNKMFDYEQRRLEVVEEKKLEDIKAGLQDIASLNSQIEKLRTEKEDLILRVQKDSETSKMLLAETDQYYKQKINYLEKELFKAKRNSDSKDPIFEKGMKILDTWTLYEHQLFMEIVDNHVFRTDYPLTKDTLESIEKYINLELVKEEENLYKLTPVGEIIYESGKITFLNR